MGTEGEKWTGNKNDEGRAWLSEAEELEEVEELLAELEVYTAATQDLLKRYVNARSDAKGHYELFENSVEPLARKIKEKVDGLRDEAVTEARGEGAHFKQDLRTTQVVSVAATLAAIFIAALLGTHFARRISQPIDGLKSAIGAVSHGRFDVMLKDCSRDEIGELAVAFANMADRLRETMVSRKYVEGIVASMSNALIVMSPNGQIERLNRAAVDLLGYGEEELAGLAIGLIFVEDELLLKGSEIADLVVTGVIQNSEKTLLTKSGRHIAVYLSAAVMRDENGALGGIVFVATDISKQRQVARMKADFISTVSHELRTPLTSIKGSLGLVANGALGSLPQRAHDMIILANKNTDRLMNLVNDILDMEKLETGRMEFDLKPSTCPSWW